MRSSGPDVWKRCTAPVAAILSLALPLAGTETENVEDLQVVPMHRAPVIDGDASDWELAHGIFGCGDVENQRDKFGFWAHAAYDQDNLYILMRYVDPTPMNNPGQVEGDYGWNGDSLQFRIVVGAGLDTEKGRASHWTCWSGRDGKTVMDVAYGLKFDKGAIKDAQAKGAKQAFKALPDKSGYVQELSVPWSLVAPDGWRPTQGEAFRLTFEPNFTVGSGGRLSAKDLFAPDTQIDRVFTFMSSQFWGHAVLAGDNAKPVHSVRLSDKREFPVKLESGVPAIDWTGLIKQRELAGFKKIAFEMPFDGYISLNLYAADGSVARQLLNAAFYTKGAHEVLWDGLSTWSWRDPGEPVAAGSYSWKALVRPGLDLRLTGWAGNDGAAPWDGPSGKDNWGGDEGAPTSAAALGDTVFLGWSGAEAGKALIAVDTQGKVKWKNSRQGMSMCSQVAADRSWVYGVNFGDKDQAYAYRLDAGSGSYAPWPGKDTPDLFMADLLDAAHRKAASDRVDALAAGGGKLIVANTQGGVVVVCDGATGSPVKAIDVPHPTALSISPGGALYAISGSAIVSIDTGSGAVTRVAEVPDAAGLAVDAQGAIYVSVHGGAQQVVVLDAAGKRLRTIGRAGGRPRTGPWRTDGMWNPHGIAIDAAGQLWVAEEDQNPRRVSVWKAASGEFVRELFGPTSYGALGGSISGKDPLVMAGMGCEWRLDATTGRASCVATIDPEGFANSRFAFGANGREYLLTAGNWAFDQGPLKVFERVKPGEWKLRSMVIYRDKDGKDISPSHPGGAGSVSLMWADANDDGKLDAGEFLPQVPGIASFSNWYMRAAPDLTLYAEKGQYRTAGFTRCGAPYWDLAKPVAMPAKGLGSADGSLVLENGEYAAAHSWFRCYDIASGKLRWSYPDTFVGVHGSHSAPQAEQGLIRGSYGPCSVVELPKPIGTVWVVPTNVGEWHLLSADGFYLGGLFQPDPIKVVFPEKAVPGVLLNDAPCGMGGEDFGGSAVFASDGKLHLQSGKTGFWNIAVDGLDKTVELRGKEAVVLTDADRPLAEKFLEQGKQALVGVQRMAVKRFTPAGFTGDLAKDFPGIAPVAYAKGFGTEAKSIVTWDAAKLHVAWEVADNTPWINGARSADAMYWGGDTVDLQLGTDPAAPRGRTEPVQGDLRLSIGAVAGATKAVVFRKVSTVKKPMMFSSGVVKNYAMDSVVVIEDATVSVVKRNGGYTVEASIPLAQLGFTPKAGLRLTGDVGATFGNQAGDRTRLRSYWTNQHVGIVDDVVFELKMEPSYWGEFSFE